MFGPTETGETLMHRPNSRTLATLLLCGVSVTAAFAPTPASAVPAIGVSPASDHPGVKVTITGSKFGASEAIDIYFDSTDEILAVTDSKGAFAKHSFTVPVDALPGEHWITAVGRRDGDGAQKLFTVATTWGEHGFKPNGKRNNPWENVVSSKNVKKLDIAWVASTGSHIVSSPAAVNGTIYVGSGDNKLYAFSAVTGATLWSASTGNSIDSSPAVANGIVYVGSDDGKLYAFNASTGALLWTASTGNAIQSSPAVANGAVIVGSADGTLYAFNASSGAPLWSTATSGLIYSSPAIADGFVYVGSSDGHLWGFHADTGVARLRLSLSGVYSSPAVANDIVYVGSFDNNLYAVEPFFGRVLWAAATSGPIFSSPAVANGVVYLNSDDTLYAFDAETGASAWSAPIHQNSQSSPQSAHQRTTSPPFTLAYSAPAVANGVVYVGSTDTNIYAFDALTGAALWSATTGDAIVSSPTVADGFVYVGSNDGRLYAFAIDGGDNVSYKRQHTQPPSFATLHPDYRLKQTL